MTPVELAKLAMEHVAVERAAGRAVSDAAAIAAVQKSAAPPPSLWLAHELTLAAPAEPVSVEFSDPGPLPRDALSDLPIEELERIRRVYPSPTGQMYAGAAGWWAERHLRLAKRSELLRFAGLVREAVGLLKSGAQPELSDLLDDETSPVEVAAEARKLGLGNPEDAVRGALVGLRPESRHYLPHVPRLI